MQVAVAQEAAGLGGRVEGPVVAILLDTAQLLADAGSLLVTGQRDCQDHLILVRLAIGHREQREGSTGPWLGAARLGED